MVGVRERRQNPGAFNIPREPPRFCLQDRGERPSRPLKHEKTPPESAPPSPYHATVSQARGASTFWSSDWPEKEMEERKEYVARSEEVKRGER